ncbi:MAG: murein biosynthesis integral membrane protein MurJ [Candidatus Hydrogenedentes bacterium]|nr:murein biosynthesis integral membrane protein MurJ [Candidatus Hydrogenedentota bacterium]
MAESKGQLARFAAVFAGGTMLSRILGLVRDIVIAGLIPTAARDSFFFAFRLPNMLRDMLGEGATNAAFVPVLAQTQEKESPEAFRSLVAQLLGIMTVVLGVITVLGVLAMPLVPYLLELLRPLTNAEPKDPVELRETVQIMQWTFPYLFFIGLAAFAMAPLFSVRHYGTPSWAPALLNIAFIGGCALFYKRFENPAWSLVVGVWLGGAAQLAVLAWAMRKHAHVTLPAFPPRHPGVGRAFLLLLPVILGQATGEVNKMVDNFFAYSLEEGVVTALFYANHLVQLPLSIFGVAVSVAILPSISRAAARGEHGEIRGTLLHGYRQTFFLVFPAMLGLIFLREPIMRLLFERGAFTPGETERAATALLYYGAGLLSFAWVKVSVQGFYALHDTKTPVIIAAASMFLNILLNCALVGPMGYRGLALATTISYTVNFALLYVFLNGRYGALWDRAATDALLRMTVATVMMCGVAYGLNYRLEFLLGTGGFAARLTTVALPVAAGVIVYALLCRALNVDEMRQLLGAFRARKG